MNVAKTAEVISRGAVGVGFVADTYQVAHGQISGEKYIANQIANGAALSGFPPAEIGAAIYYGFDLAFPGAIDRGLSALSESSTEVNVQAMHDLGYIPTPPIP
jgi:hypothetical protein